MIESQLVDHFAKTTYSVFTYGIQNPKAVGALLEDERTDWGGPWKC